MMLSPAHFWAIYSLLFLPVDIVHWLSLHINHICSPILKIRWLLSLLQILVHQNLWHFLYQGRVILIATLLFVYAIIPFRFRTAVNIMLANASRPPQDFTSSKVGSKCILNNSAWTFSLIYFNEYATRQKLITVCIPCWRDLFKIFKHTVKICLCLLCKKAFI